MNNYSISEKTKFVVTGVTPPSTFTFSPNGEVIMRLDAKGMTYKGVRIEDAGEAHKAFLATMAIMSAKGN